MRLNTSNQGKYKEFKRLFHLFGHELEVSHIELKEIDADPITVVAHKASQMEEDVIVDDTSLEIEGASVGVNVRWVLEHLSNYKGRKAAIIILLAHRKKDKVLIYQGKVTGTIVEARGDKSFGFDPIFLPDGATETLGESKPIEFDARAQAVKALINNTPFATSPIISDWNGSWQPS